MTDTSSLYVYGLVDDAVRLHGIDLGTGVASAAVTLLDQGVLTALVSDIPPGLVAHTRRNMLSHPAVLEGAMVHATVLPVRFGTGAPAAAALAGCIETNATEFRTALADIAGRVELGFKASWRDGVVYAEIVAGDSELCRLRTRPPNEQAIADRCAQRVNFRYVGPVPPNNFIKLHTDWLAGAR